MADCNLENCENRCFESNDKCILHCEKDDWFELCDNNKNWSKSNNKIGLFWTEVRNKIENRDTNEEYNKGAYLDFANTIFPIFEEKKIEDDSYENDNGDEISFVNYFEDNFSNSNISQSQSPSYQLNVRLDFNGSIFLDDVNFINYNFQDNVSFNHVTFFGECRFLSTTFNHVTFDNINFFKSVLFENSKVNLYSYKTGDFKDSIFHSKVEFDNTTFGSETDSKTFDVDFRGTQFKRVHFQSCNFFNGLRFYKDTILEYLDIQSMNLQELYIAGNIPTIAIRGNRKEINKLTIKHNNLKNLMIHNCTINSDFLMNDKQWIQDKVFELENLNLNESTFNGKVKIQYYTINKKASFYNTKFKRLADFYRTTFNTVDFGKTDFEEVAVFSETTFKEDIDFKYVKFLNKSIFRDTVIKGKLNLRNSIFSDDANFLDITSIPRIRNPDDEDEFIGQTTSIDVANRETARIIKDSYDKSNNIIEANKFYALEMDMMESELSFFRNPVEWLIFKLHSISSEHSQSPYLAFLWIFNLSYLYVIFCLHNNVFDVFLAISTLIVFVVSFIDIKAVLKVLLTISVIEFVAISSVNLNEIADKINPFSIMTSWDDDLPFHLLLFKVIIAYLIYQFIISVRQNTRRK